MPEVRVDIEVWCNECGDGICHLATEHRKGGGLDVTPCVKCMNANYNNGYKAGKADAEEHDG